MSLNQALNELTKGIDTLTDTVIRNKWLGLAKLRLATTNLWADTAEQVISIATLKLIGVAGAVMFTATRGSEGMDPVVRTIVLSSGENYQFDDSIAFMIVVPITENATTGRYESMPVSLYKCPTEVRRVGYYLSRMTGECGFDNEHVAKARKLFEAIWSGQTLVRDPTDPSDYCDRDIEIAWHYFLRGFNDGRNVT